MGRIAPVAALIALGLTAGGCSMSYQLESMFGKSDKPETTGSLKLPPGSEAMAKAELPPEVDLAYARAAVAEVLNRGGKDSSVPWENPHTGARGTVTPIAAERVSDGTVCRDFLASYVRGKTESWLRGEACREKKGRWEVHSLKPSMRS